jgi:hypothetical protein
MKKNELALLILAVSISLVGAYFIGNAVVGKPGADGAQVEVVEPITAEVAVPDAKIFNKNAINPAVPVKIGDPANQSPFTENR